MRISLATIQKLMLRFLMIGLVSFQYPTMRMPASMQLHQKEINLEGIENDILFYVNEHRKSMGLQALQMIKIASVKAAEHSADMAQHKTGFGHEGFEERVKYIANQLAFNGNITDDSIGIKRSKKALGNVVQQPIYNANSYQAAENVAYGKLTAKMVVEGWLNSPGHRKNMEGKYALTGIGVAKDEKGIVFYTQIFIQML